MAKWESDSLFKVPESVLFDANNQVLYVSNIEGTEPWGADGKGSIGQLGLDGKIINAEWVKGLQAPKGMGIFNGKLYVADLKEVVTIDIASGKIENRFKVPGAVGLNDISIDATGVIYVTDSQGKRLYRIESNSASIILDSLAGPNGVLVNGSNLYILNAGGFYKISKSGGLGLIADGMEGGTDGVENVKGDEFIVSCWAGAVWYINDDGRKELLYDGKSIGKNTADIGFDPATRTVYVPTFWKNTVMAFEVAEN
ncbi:MAG: SMP-30/gluconolactonase/LRE family protein [Saprospiraceae bacterium]|nr:SMP-30/gluconolactonase/LRE family protein [Saprospiraceae bacterium]